jgi:hypothetical protein
VPSDVKVTKMPKQGVLDILLFKERMEGFHRCAVILQEWPEPFPIPNYLQSAQQVVRELMWFDGTHPVSHSIPLLIQQAVEWAHSEPLPSNESLRATRAALEVGIAARVKTLTLLRKIFNGVPAPDWLSDAERVAIAEQRQAERILSESWPSWSKEEEVQDRREEERDTKVSMSQTFAQIAGVSEEQWLQKVAEHKQKYGK